jgi:REP element-mobilizing transposase RayT
MPLPRSAQISLDATPYYHCVSRCVRRAFLCGKDERTGDDYEHRRAWVEDRLLELAQIFALDVCAHAVLSNHTHVVLFVDQEKAQAWTPREVIERWHQLFSGIPLSQRYLRGDDLYPAEQDKLMESVDKWRGRLMDVSWFMRCLNEHIARRANEADKCTGRFWEGRFKSQAILDEAALAACLAYVDLNPVRAGMADTPETSAFTSLKRRIQALNTKPEDEEPQAESLQPKELLPFVGNPRQDMPKGLPFRLQDYLELVDWTGRIIRADKRGQIAATTPPILQRLNIEPDAWLTLATEFEDRFPGMVGREEAIQTACHTLGRHWSRSAANCRALFSSG